MAGVFGCSAQRLSDSVLADGGLAGLAGGKEIRGASAQVAAALHLSASTHLVCAPGSLGRVTCLGRGDAHPAVQCCRRLSCFSSARGGNDKPSVKQGRFVRFTFIKVCKALCAASDGCWCWYSGLFYFCTTWESCCDLLFSRLLGNLQGLLAALQSQMRFFSILNVLNLL